MSSKPEKRIVLFWFLQTSLVLTVFSSIISGGLTVLTDENSFMLFSLSITAANIVALIHTVFRYSSWSYELREDHLYLEHGVLVKVKTMVPFVRIQHVDTQKNIVDRLLKLSSVVVYTAGSRGSDVSIPGIIPEDGDLLQDKLKNKAVESEDRDGV